MNNVDRLLEDATTLADFAREYARYLGDLLGRIDYDALQRAGDALDAARTASRTVFVIGNGGSAATASHFATDLAYVTKVTDGRPFRAISLADNNAYLTALGNDIGYDSVFVEQLRPLLGQGDVLLAISASGNSPNILKAVDYANAHGGVTVGFTGFDGGELARRAMVSVCVPTPKGEYGPVEDAHMIFDHMVTSFLGHQARRLSR